MASETSKFKYCEHVERPADAPPGVRVVEFLNISYNADAPEPWHEVAVYRPLDQTTHVYDKGGWDHRPLAEFLQRYRPLTDARRVHECDEVVARIYAPGAHAVYLIAKNQGSTT